MLTRPARGAQMRRIRCLPLRLCDSSSSGQPLTATFVPGVSFAPFWAMIVVGASKRVPHRRPLGASAELGPMGRLTLTLVMGTSGRFSKVEVVMLERAMWVWPTSTTSRLSPLSTRSRSGNWALPCETSQAVPVSAPGSTGVFTVTVPTRAVDWQLPGGNPLSKLAARHAFWSVEPRATSRLGSCSWSSRMFASPAGCVTVTVRAAPPAFEVLAPLLARSCGLKARAPQSFAWKGLERASWAPKVESSSDSLDSGAQLVGFDAKCGRLTFTLMCFRRSGTPPKTLGRVVVVVTRPL